mgnify:CR=1 FL=1
MSDDDTDDSQKTEDPTPKKLEEARKRGQVPMSKETNTWLMMFVGTMVIVALGPGIMMRLTYLLQAMLSESWQMSAVPGTKDVLYKITWETIGILGFALIILVIAAVAGPFAQVGPLVSSESIKPNFDKLSPVAGFKRIFSKNAVFEFVKGLIKVSLLGWVSFVALEPYFPALEHTIDMELSDTMSEMMAMFIHLMTAFLIALLLLAAVDLVYQRWSHYKQMRMSKQEIKDEYKQTEGDPHVRSRLRQIRMERARNRMMQSVPESTVVVTNPTHYAIALKYEPEEMDAPICVAKGMDLIALKIREIAEENNVIIVENPPLARTLYKVIEINETIPPEHYKAVAEVISYVFRLKKKM